MTTLDWVNQKLTNGDWEVETGDMVITAGVLNVQGTQVVTLQQSAIVDAGAASGTATSGGYGFVDATEMNNFIDAVNTIGDQLNALLSALRTHGLIAT